MIDVLVRGVGCGILGLGGLGKIVQLLHVTAIGSVSIVDRCVRELSRVKTHANQRIHKYKCNISTYVHEREMNMH